MMARARLMDVAHRLLVVTLMSASSAAVASAANEKLMIPVGHAQVVVADEPVKTVVIAEPKIADAAVGSERSVVVNAKAVGSTSLVVYGEAGRFKVYEIEVFTPNADKQVALHVRVAEVNETAKRVLGIDIAGAGRPRSPGHEDFITGGLFTGKVTSPGIPLTIGPTTDGAFRYERDNPNFILETTWQALEQHGDIRLLANPTLVARSGEKAKFLAGGEFPVPVASNSTGNVVQITIDWREFGVKLDFTPTVEPDGGVTLQVAPEVSQLDFTSALRLSGFVVPVVDKRATSTTVHLNSGEHLVIGGLKQTDRNKVVRKTPILGDIPILNLLFSTTSTESTERELMVVVSPEVLEGASSTLPKLPTDRPMKK